MDFFSPEEAYALTQRSKRGLIDTSKPGCLIRDHIFMSGHRKVRTLTPQKRKMLFTGRIATHHLPIVEELLKENP